MAMITRHSSGAVYSRDGWESIAHVGSVEKLAAAAGYRLLARTRAAIAAVVLAAAPLPQLPRR
jgi:hypothetical protein